MQDFALRVLSIRTMLFSQTLRKPATNTKRQKPCPTSGRKIRSTKRQAWALFPKQTNIDQFLDFETSQLVGNTHRDSPAVPHALTSMEAELSIGSGVTCGRRRASTSEWLLVKPIRYTLPNLAWQRSRQSAGSRRDGRSFTRCVAQNNGRCACSNMGMRQKM